MGVVHLLLFSLFLFAISFVLRILDAKFSREFRTFHNENFNNANVFGRLSKAALNRTKTATCRVQMSHSLNEIASKSNWPVKAVENSCSDLFDAADLYSPVGCFNDFPSNRLLGAFSTEFTSPQTSPKPCVQFCLNSGFRFAGVEFGGSKCFCGSSDADFKNRLIAHSSCDHSHCNDDLCDAFNAISVYRTGIKNASHSDSTLKFHPFSASSSKVKILFLLQLNGRDSRQIRRLLRILFLPRHFYFVHIDNRHEFMLKEMLKVEQSLKAKGFTNFRVTKRRMPTIWGGSTLLNLFLWTIAQTLGETNSQWAHWDYIINMSETDMPILSVEELEQNLAKNRGLSFLKSHGQNTAAFLKKQGLHFHFMQCEQRMWRIADRPSFPDNLRLDGGSDWVLVHRDLALFAISNSLLPSQMRLLFASVLLPLESFFHTLALNSGEFCLRIIYHNFHLTNWRRRQGCRCAPLKPMVDWCGCSPLALRTNQIEHKLELNLSQSKLHFFGRKFDSFIDMAPIAFVERLSLRFRAHLLPVQSAVFSSFWLNVFSSHSPSDVLPFGLNVTILTLFPSLIVRFLLPNNGTFQRLNDVHIYKEFSSAPSQFITTFSVAFGSTNCLIQALIGRKSISTTVHRTLDLDLSDNWLIYEGIRFVFDANEGIEVGLGFDEKEEIFRAFLPLISSSSKFTLKWRWIRHDIGVNGHAKWTSPPIQLSLHRPDGLIFQVVSVPSYDSVFGTQFVHFELDRLSGVSPGIWSVVLHDNKSFQNCSMIASVSFPIFPDQSSPDNEWDEHRIFGLITDFFFFRDFCFVSTSPNSPRENTAKGPISNFANCSELPWSTLFFDEKSVFPPPNAASLWDKMHSLSFQRVEL